MSQQTPSSNIQGLFQSQKLHVIRLHDAGLSVEEICSTANVTATIVPLILQARQVYESPSSAPTSRNFLTLCDKIRVLHYLKTDLTKTQIGSLFAVYRFAVGRVQKSKDRIILQESLRIPHGMKRQLYARYREVDAEIMEFLQFGRSQILSVSKTILQQRARIAADRLNISEFKASYGYINRFLRRNPVQKSMRLHRKGSSLVPVDHTIRIEEIRSTVVNYPMKMVYNRDETGLLYRLGPNRTYLLAFEDRRNTRGTELQKYKSRVTAVLCVNAGGSHAVPLRTSGKMSVQSASMILDSPTTAISTHSSRKVG